MAMFKLEKSPGVEAFIYEERRPAAINTTNGTAKRAFRIDHTLWH